MRTKFLARVLSLQYLALLMSMTPASAQSNVENGKLKIHVTPKRAYVFVDSRKRSATEVRPSS